MNILVGCEESQAVTLAFRKLGHVAFSCDLQKCSGGHPEWHLNTDVFNAINGGELVTESGKIIYVDSWDVGVFFPDCTYLTCAAEWAYKDQEPLKSGKPVGKRRRELREMAIQFFKMLENCKIPRVALENPVGVLSSRHRLPDQIIQPYMFGDNASKKTCLWIKNLPLLTLPHRSKWYPPRVVNGKPRYGNQTDSGQNNLPPSKDRAKLRSKTYPGIARAMANAWGNPGLIQKTLF